MSTTNELTYTSITIPDYDFKADFAPIESGKANEFICQKITGDVDQPCSYRIAIDDVKNVYSGTDIQPALYSVQKKGKRLLISLRDTVRKVNEVTGEKVDYPLQCNIVFQYPVSSEISATELYSQMQKTLAAIIHGPIEGSDRYDAELNKLMRGSLDIREDAQ